jgi:plasmid stability protein
VATIQIRDIPDDVHELLQKRAREAGQSLQVYMHEWVTSTARERMRWAEAVEEYEAMLEANPPSITRQQIMDDLDDDRRR